MMGSHILLLAIFAMFVSVVFAAIMRDDAGEQMNLGLRMFGGLVVTAVILGWLMYPFPV